MTMISRGESNSKDTQAMMMRINFNNWSIYRAMYREAFRALWIVPILASTAVANNAKISPDLQRLLSNPSSNVNVIVQFNSSLPCSGGAFGGSIICPALTQLGGVINQVF